VVGGFGCWSRGEDGADAGKATVAGGWVEVMCSE
jgi:hypothetical protein